MSTSTALAPRSYRELAGDFVGHTSDAGRAMISTKYRTEMQITGLGAGVYAGSSFGTIGAVAGGYIGYQAPVVGYGAALWKLGHPILGALCVAAPLLVGGVRARRRR